MENVNELINFLKTTGFVIQTATSYNGMGNSYDYGPLGSLLKNNIKKELINYYVHSKTNSFLVDGSILTMKEVLNASGHLSRFNDYFVDCKKCKNRFKVEEGEDLIKCPIDGSTDLTKPRSFNLLFKTKIGSLIETSKDAYLRPETAQSIFANFNYYKTFHKNQVPFRICQIGKAFRNEIVPSNFLYRMLEFEQFEVEHFIEESNWNLTFEEELKYIQKILKVFLIDSNKLRLHNQTKEELAHYSKRTVDFEFYFPFGWKELLGLAYRQDYDLKRHQEYSKTNMEILDANNKKFIPHVVETSYGIDRLLFALFLSWYKKERINEEDRIVLKCPYFLAPYKIAILPLSTKLREEAKTLFSQIIKECTINNINVDLNLSSTSIGKKYRRHDQIGTPFCLTIDFESIKDQTVTIRNRDSMKQIRLHKTKIVEYIKKEIHKNNE